MPEVDNTKMSTGKLIIMLSDQLLLISSKEVYLESCGRHSCGGGRINSRGVSEIAHKMARVSLTSAPVDEDFTRDANEGAMAQAAHPDVEEI